MEGDWEILPLSQAGIQLIDCEHRTPPEAEDGFPYVTIPQMKDGKLDLSDARLISPDHFAEWTRKAYPTAYDVILSRRCNPGETAFVPPGLDCALGQNLVILRANGSKVEPRFLRWLARGREWWQQVGKYINVGAVFDSLKCEEIPLFELSIPPLPEQRAIAHILGTLDDKIELNRRMNETLEEIARAIFKSWFVDFEPVRANAEGRDTGLPDYIADLFPDSFEDSELGEIPKGWDVKSLGDVSLKTQYGYTASAKSEQVGPKFLRITDINKRSWIDWTSVPHCVIEDSDIKKYKLHKGDILIARMADPGHGIMIEEDIDAVFASYLIRFQPYDSTYSRFLQYWIRSDAYWHLVGSRGGGTTRVSLNAKVLSRFTMILPPNRVARAFDVRADSLRSRIVANVKEASSLASLRDSLLPKLISGELRIENPERFLPVVNDG